MKNLIEHLNKVFDSRVRLGIMSALMVNEEVNFNDLKELTQVTDGNLASHLHGVTLPAGFSASDVTPAALSHLPAAVHIGFVAGYAESIQTVFLIAVPIAALAFLATWLIPQVELKQWTAPAASAAPTTQALASADD